MTRGREKNKLPPPVVAVPGLWCVGVYMCAHTYRKEIYGSWSLEKHVKLQGKEEEEKEYGSRGGRREEINSIRSFFTWLPPFERRREASTK
jgi:hypothetical protein